MHGPKDAVGLERWDDLRVFLAVLRHGSFSAAARALALEQSTVSRRIAALEVSLGAQLFDRLPEGPVARDLALRLQAHAQRIESEVLDFGDRARGDDRRIAGQVTLATTESFAVHVLIPHVLAGLQKAHPKLALHLLTSDSSADLSRREADLALRFYRPRRGDLVSKRVARLPLAVLAHKRLARHASAHPAQLRWLAVQVPHVQQPEQAWLDKLGVTPSLTLSSHLSLVEAVRAGLGVALLTESYLTLDKNLRALPVAVPAGAAVDLWLAAPRTLRVVPRVAAVWEALEAGLANLVT